MPVPDLPSPYEVVAEGLKLVIDNEFDPAVAVHDRLHESLGRDRVSIGISPNEETARGSNQYILEIWLTVQFYDLWTQEISPETSVNPINIARKADRFRRAVKVAQTNYAGSDQVWYYDVQSITYPNDPTGNKSRFEATIRAYGTNDGLVETA